MATGQGTDHEDSHWQPVPQSNKTNLLVDSGEGLADGLARSGVVINLRDQDIGWVRGSGTEDTGNVTTEEGDTGLLHLGVLLLRLGQTCVDHLDNLLVGSELHHGVRDLSEPQRNQTGVKVLGQVRDRLRRQGGLVLHLHRLERTQEQVGNELGRCRRSQVHKDVGSANQVGIRLLEVLVTTVLERTLQTISDESRRKPGVDLVQPFSPDNLLNTGIVRGVQVLVNLQSALDEIQWKDKGMSWGTRKKPANGTGPVVCWGVEGNVFVWHYVDCVVLLLL